MNASAPRPDVQRRGVAAALFVVFLGAAALATRPLSVDLSTRLPANADALVFSWTLKTMCGGLAHPADPFRGNIFYPDTASLLYTEPLLGEAIQVLPLCALDLDHVTLYNLSFIVILAMSALGAFLLAREITGSGPAALVGAFVFAFTTANYDSSARMQVVAGQWTPFCVLFLIRSCRDGRLKDAALAGITFAMQAWSCTYYEIFLAILLLLAIPFWFGLSGGGEAIKPRLQGFALSALIAAALVLPVNLAQRRHLEPVLVTRPQAQQIGWSFFTEVLPTNLLYGNVLGRTRVAYDALYFPGLVPLGLVVSLLVSRMKTTAERERGLGAVAFIGVAAIVFSFGAHVATPWGDLPGPLALFAKVPGLGQARVPSRFLMFSRLALAVIAACGARRLIDRVPSRRWLTAAALALACFVEHWSTPLDSWLAPTRIELPSVYAWLEQNKTAAPILEFPPALQRLRREEASWLHTAAIHRLPMVNGFSSFRPAWYEFVMDAALLWPDERLVTILRQLGVRSIVVHPRPRGLAEVDDATAALFAYAARAPEQLTLVKTFSDARRLEGLWSRLGDESLFAIVPGPPLRAATVGPALAREGWTCRSSEPSCESALDGDASTLLRGREAQDAGQFLKVWFKEPAVVSAVSINLGRFPEGFPRDPAFRILQDKAWVPMEATLDVATFLRDTTSGHSANPVMQWTFPEARASGFEIRLRSGGHRFRELDIPEINAHSSSAPTTRTSGR